jgi:glycosyltransferase involved in cell wall biosynthesis
MAYYLQGHRILHIRAHFLHTEAVSAYWLSLLLDIPYSLTVHTRMIYFPRLLIQEVLEHAAFCVGISTDVIEFVHEFNRKVTDTYLIRNGILLDEFPTFIKIRNSGIPLIIGVGRLIRKKGFDTLIQACVLLKKEGVQFVCHIVGSGGEYKLLKKLVIENGMQQQIRFLGALSYQDVLNQYQEAALLIAPSRICKDDVDGLPTVIIEAFAMGLPVIATSVAGIPELVIQNETGLLVPGEDPTALFRAIYELIDNRELRQRFGEAGRKKVVGEYNIIDSAQQINDLIQKTIVQ